MRVNGQRAEDEMEGRKRWGSEKGEKEEEKRGNPLWCLKGILVCVDGQSFYYLVAPLMRVTPRRCIRPAAILSASYRRLIVSLSLYRAEPSDQLT